MGRANLFAACLVTVLSSSLLFCISSSSLCTLSHLGRANKLVAIVCSRMMQLLLSLFVVLTIAGAQEAVAKNQPTLPEFYKADCEQFRLLLKEHSDRSFFDRKHATNLGIVATVLFWTGVPSVPLGIAAIWMGRRIATDARQNLVSMNVTSRNYETINKLCARLLREEESRNVSFDGRNNAAIVLGSVAIALAMLTFIQGFFGVFLCCLRTQKKMKMKKGEASGTGKKNGAYDGGDNILGDGKAGV